ncbi:MAG: hypothetical protein ACFFCW_14205 [Candidatus Hodarchaeota archaeon]
MIDLVQRMLDECCFISGGRKSGKTNLGILLVDQLLNSGVQVKVIDSSRQWLKRSSVPHYVKVASARVSSYGLFAIWNLPNVWDCIYDCSRLTTTQMREFVSGMMQNDFQEAVILDEQGVRVKAFYVLEECQNLIPNSALRSYSFQEISRFVTQGRNFGLSYIALTQRLASVDSNLVEISGLKYFGKTEGDNNRRKAKAWLPKDYLNKARDLQTGEFLQQYGSKITLEKVPLFQSLRKPQPYIEPPKPKKPSLIQRMIKAIVGD